MTDVDTGVYLVHENPEISALGGPVPASTIGDVWGPRGWSVATDDQVLAARRGEDIHATEITEPDGAAPVDTADPLSASTWGADSIGANDNV